MKPGYCQAASRVKSPPCARRHGEQWFIGVLNGAAHDTTLNISMKFLAKDVGKRRAWETFRTSRMLGIGTRRITSDSSFNALLPARGGFVAWIRK